MAAVPPGSTVNRDPAHFRCTLCTTSGRSVPYDRAMATRVAEPDAASRARSRRSAPGARSSTRRSRWRPRRTSWPSRCARSPSRSASCRRRSTGTSRSIELLGLALVDESLRVAAAMLLGRAPPRPRTSPTSSTTRCRRWSSTCTPSARTSASSPASGPPGRPRCARRSGHQIELFERELATDLGRLPAHRALVAATTCTAGAPHRRLGRDDGRGTDRGRPESEARDRSTRRAPSCGWCWSAPSTGARRP